LLLPIIIIILNFKYYYYYLLRPKAAQHNITIAKKTAEKHKKLKTKIQKN